MSLLLTACTSLALAGDAKVKIEPVRDLWLSHDQTSAFPVDNEGTTGGQGSHIDIRFRTGLIFRAGDVAVNVEVGGPADQIYGDTWSIPGTIDERNRHEKRVRIPQLRKLSLTANLEYIQLETGLTTSHWGLGMIANDGEHEPFFGQPEFGDRVVRARITTKPGPESPWHFTAAWDRVLQDDLTIDANTQWTNQAFFSVLWLQDDDQAGINGVVRRQDELLQSRTTRVTALDAYTDLTLSLTDGISLNIGAEMAGVTGKTNRTTTYNSPDRLHVLSAGATAVGMLGFYDDTLQVGFSTGYATGDGDPNDDTLRDFTFDRNFDVGMVLFDEVLGGIDAAHHRLISDPQYAGQPPDGADATVHEGAFRRASYLQPRLEYTPIPAVRIRAGVLFAWATAPIAHGFYTHRNGGNPVNHLGQPTRGYRLGTEYDWAVQVSPFTNPDNFFSNTRISLQGGHAVLDSNLGGDRMGRIDRYIVMFHVL